MNNSERLFWADTLKILAVLGVITIHSAAPLLVQFNEIGAKAWWVGNIYNSASRWCIPVFFMLSGSFLLGKANGMSVTFFFKRRAQRIIVPFVLWSGIYFFWRILANGEPLDPISFFPLFVSGPIYYHLWFFYVLIALYILTPILSSYIKGASRSNLVYFVLLWLSLTMAWPMLQNFWGNRTFPSDTNFSSALYYTGYFILGYALKNISLQKKHSAVLGAVFLIGFIATAYGTYILTVDQNGGTFDSLFYNYFSFNVFLMSFSIFLLAKNIRFRADGKLAGLFRKIAVCVPGIFLIHAMIIAVLNRGYLGFTLSQSTIDPAIGVPVFAGTVFLGSFVIVFVIRKIPVIRYVVP